MTPHNCHIWFLNQPIVCLLNLLALGEIDPFHLCGLHLLLQHLRVVRGNRYAVACLKASLITFCVALLNTELASASITPSIKRKCSFLQKKIKFTCQSTKQLKFENYQLNLPRISSPRHPERSPSWHTTWAPSGSLSVQLLIVLPWEPCRPTTTNKRTPTPSWHNYGVHGHFSWRPPTAAHQLDGSSSCPLNSEQVKPGERVTTYKNWITYFIQKWI
jgi:hypothetical protein